jgi:hypothetical protein
VTTTATSSPMSTFAEATRVTAAGPGRFDAAVGAGWTIGGKPNGGYLLALLGRAAAAVSGRQHVVAASAQYLSSPDPGPVAIEVAVRRAGRSTSHVHGLMRQGDRLCVEALLTTSHLDADSAPYWDRGAPAASSVPFGDCTRLVPHTPDGTEVAILDRVEVRLEPETSGFTAGHPSGRGELRGWLSLPEGEPFDPTSLLFAVDAYPPGTFDVEYSGWVPTLELTVYVRALPAPGPVRVLQRAQLIDGHRVDEACFIWDRIGRLVAHGTQLAAIRLG